MKNRDREKDMDNKKGDRDIARLEHTELMQRVCDQISIRIMRGEDGPWMLLMGLKIGALLDKTYWSEGTVVIGESGPVANPTVREVLLRRFAFPRCGKEDRVLVGVEVRAGIPPNAIRLIDPD